jgi:iron complex outermembrane receptor protein
VFVDDANSDAAASWTRIDLRAGLRQRVGRWRFAQLVFVENLADRAYVGSVIVNEAQRRFFVSAPGRNWSAGVTASYVFD